MSKNTKILLIIFGAVVLAGIFYLAQLKFFIPKADAAEAQAVRNTVENFGNALKNVSVLSPTAAQDINTSYNNFVAPTLLSRWENDPSKAPGRFTSSPWPDRIEVVGVNKLPGNSYEVSGNVVEMTSQEAANGGNAGEYPIIAEVIRINNKWLIASFNGYPNATTESIEYQNAQYGFLFSLPQSWAGYSIISQEWNGQILDSEGSSAAATKISGPEILIRNPQWIVENPYQDIPIMIFTPSQWDMILQEKLAVSAAPIGPSELGQNANYIFALPARYNFAYPTGYEDVQQILQGHPLSPIM